MLIVKIIYTAFMVWLIYLLFCLPGRPLEERKNKIPF